MSRIKIIDQYRGTDILAKYNKLRLLINNGSDHEDLRIHNLTELLVTLKKSNNYYKPLLLNYSETEIKTDPEKVLLTLPFIDKKSINENYNLIYTHQSTEDQRKKRKQEEVQVNHFIIL